MSKNYRANIAMHAASDLLLGGSWQLSKHLPKLNKKNNELLFAALHAATAIDAGPPGLLNAFLQAI